MRYRRLIGLVGVMVMLPLLACGQGTGGPPEAAKEKTAASVARPNPMLPRISAN